MKKFVIILFAAAAAMSAYAQDFEVPDYKLESFSDYAQLEGDILKCADWLINSPFDPEKTDKRNAATKFMLEWLGGNAHIYVQFYPGLTDFQYTAHNLISVYIAGWTRYALENKDYNRVKCATAATYSVIDFYERNKKDIGKNKNVEALIKKKAKGKLDEYIAECTDPYNMMKNMLR